MRIVAHRGCSAVAPENTLAAIRRAVEAGADGIEVDVRLTRDGAVVLLHDPDLLRTAGDPRPVARCTLLDLAALDVGRWFGPDFAGEPIPTLDAAIAAANGVPMDIELKAEVAGIRLADRVLEVLRTAGALDRCWITSSDLGVLTHVAVSDPSVRTGWVVDGPLPVELPTRLRCVCVAEWLVDADLPGRAAAAGLEVWAWTVNDAARARELREMGVAAVITDDPERLRHGL